MLDYISNFQITSMMGILLYFVPLTLCAVGYTYRIWLTYRRDIMRRNDDPKNYYPLLHIGDIVGWAFVTICPIANLWCACFDVFPKLFGDFFRRITIIFDQPLVPKRQSN